MSLHHENGDMRRPYLRCDADDCKNKLRGPRIFSLADQKALPSTGWRTVYVDGERRDYCMEHPNG